jgi:hypothetical protein
MKEIKENKKIYSVKAGTIIISRIRDVFYKGAGSCHHKNKIRDTSYEGTGSYYYK